MRCLVSGGAGFIGSNLVRRLLEDQHDVTVLDDVSTGTLNNLAEVEDSIEVTVGDISDARAVRKAMQGAGVVFHLAALASVARSVADPESTHRVNADGTLNMLLAARDAGARRFVYASSSSVYGDSPSLPKVEEMVPKPISPYAASKLAGEAFCRAFSHSYGLETVGLRFFNVFGPRQDPLSEYAAVIPRFINRMLYGASPQVYGDGLQTRDFTYVANVLDACVLAAQAPSLISGEVMNVGCGGSITLMELIEILSDLVGSKVRPQFQEPRTGDVLHSMASIEKARRIIGYEPSISVRDGLAETVKWFAGQRQRVTTLG